jgi:hypothetical protein
MHDLPTPPQNDRHDHPLAIDGRNAISSHELLMASAEVIGQRLAMGLSGVLDPANANHAELARLVPEKSEAVSASGMALVERSGRMIERMVKFSTDEMLIAARACGTLAACRTPAALAAAQQGLTFAWVTRVMAQSTQLGGLALQSTGAAMAPFHRTATANARRLRAT